MLTATLKTFGLDEKEIAVYLRLLSYGSSSASTLAYLIAQPRTSIQNILSRLEKLSLATKMKEKNTFIYSAMHPEELLEQLHNKQLRQKRLYKKLESDLEKIMPQLTGMMQNNKNLPKVQFFRGRAGAKHVLFDTLTSKTELKDFANISAMNTEIADINAEYIRAREKTKIKKRSIILDTPDARKERDPGTYSPKSYIAWKYISSELYPFSTEMNIYDGKISYLTYMQNELIGVIIEDAHIYQMHDSIWNLIWNATPKSPESKWKVLNTDNSTQ